MIIEISVLWHVARHPIPRTLEDEKIENAVINRVPRLISLRRSNSRNRPAYS
jgi:hypothetical protein